MLTAIGGGALVNQFGLPDILTRNILGKENVGQNWVGDLLGGIPGIPSDTVIGNTPEQKAMMKRIGEAQALSGVINPHADTRPVQVQQSLTDVLNTLRKPSLIQSGINLVKDQFGNVVDKFTGQTSADETTKGGQEIRWKMPLAIGTAMGAAQAAMPKSVLPHDTSGIDQADIRRRAKIGSDPVNALLRILAISIPDVSVGSLALGIAACAAPIAVPIARGVFHLGDSIG